MNTDAETVVGRIYEAALVPQLWEGALEGAAALSGSASGALHLHHSDGGLCSRSTARMQPVVARFHNEPQRYGRLLRVERSIARAHEACFLRMCDLLSAHELAQDLGLPLLRQEGLDEQAASHILLPTGQDLCLTFERAAGQGPHSPAQLQVLDRLRPHLARAAVIAARLGLERAQLMVDALHAVGLPAAALAADGRVLATNAAFDTTPALRPAAFGQIRFESPEVQALYREALREAAAPAMPRVRSIPVPAGEDPVARPPLALHLVPVHGTAHDFFTRAALVLIAVPFGGAAAVPELSLLHGLFDLTPKEAALAAALAGGQPLKDAAASLGMRYSTARTHLEHIFRKTGVRQQTQLVLLLQGARGIVAS